MPGAKGIAQMFYRERGTGDPVPLNTDLNTISSWIQTKALDLDAEHVAKFLDRILYSVTDRVDQNNLVIEIYGSDDEDGPFTLLDTIVVTAEYPGYTDPDGKVWYKFKFIDNNTQNRWKLHGFQVWGEIGGDEY